MRSMAATQENHVASEERAKENEKGDGRTLFEFSAEDVVSCSRRDVGWSESHHTEFDCLLLGRWEQAMKDGVFRYDLTEVVSRVVPGRHGIVAMNNPKRFSHRRVPADMQSLVQPFDTNQFNFNKVKEKEILFEVCRKEDHKLGEDKRHMMVVNVSPIDRGHVLLVPEPSSCIPQVMTEDSLRLCLELMSLSRHSGFCMVANSLLAYASVNHLHYHFMYISHTLPAKSLDGEELSGCRGCYVLSNHYVRGFGFQLDSDPASCARLIYQVVSLLLESGVPYNIVMLRGPPPFTTSHNTQHSHIIRTILVPRKPVIGFKQLYQREGGPPPFFAAACELGLGLIPIMDQERYTSISEDEILSRLREQGMGSEKFTELCSIIRCNVKS